MDAGKLPNEILGELLTKVRRRDPRVIVGPGIGRDAAVIDAGGPMLLVAKSDPITFASDLIGWYAVHVNANDVACMGARPTWFMATVLLPQGAGRELAETIFDQIADACESLEVELVGGHTEITYRLDRPIVVGGLLGEVERERLVRPEEAKPGDALLLTKGIAIEGTAVLAREAAKDLRGAGVSREVIENAQEYIFRPGISVVKEARAACEAAHVHAMHDPTEGGLATALYEVSEACDLGLRAEADAIEVLPATRAICDAAGLNPLGLLASGALLLVVAEEDREGVTEAIRAEGVAVANLGTLAAKGGEAVIWERDQGRAIPRFARDEVARFLDRSAE
jgi:hydrogenase maturation factor